MFFSYSHTIYLDHFFFSANSSPTLPILQHTKFHVLSFSLSNKQKSSKQIAMKTKPKTEKKKKIITIKNNKTKCTENAHFIYFCIVLYSPVLLSK